MSLLARAARCPCLSLALLLVAGGVVQPCQDLLPVAPNDGSRLVRTQLLCHGHDGAEAIVLPHTLAVDLDEAQGLCYLSVHEIQQVLIVEATLLEGANGSDEILLLGEHASAEAPVEPQLNPRFSSRWNWIVPTLPFFAKGVFHFLLNFSKKPTPRPPTSAREELRALHANLLVEGKPQRRVCGVCPHWRLRSDIAAEAQHGVQCEKGDAVRYAGSRGQARDAPTPAESPA